MRIVIAGCGNYGQVYLSYLRRHSEYEIVGFVDDDRQYLGMIIQDLPVLGTSDDLSTLKEQGIEGVIAPIGNNRARVRILRQARDTELETPNFIHPTAIVSEDAMVGKGIYVLAGSIIMPYADMRDYVMISMGVKLAHHTTLHSGVFLSTGVNMGAGIDVGECAYVGIGATIMTGVKSLGTDAMVGAGAVVIRDVPSATTVAGVPAKPLHRN